MAVRPSAAEGRVTRRRFLAVAGIVTGMAGWQREPGAFGRTCSAETFGHHGSTGTVIWHDPATVTTCVVLTTRPATDSKSALLVPVSEIIGRTSG